MYKLIAIDLDGTLLNDDKIITSKNIEVVKKVIDAGYRLVFATGRRYLAAKEFIDLFDEDLVIIANNGNMIRHTKKDELIDHSYIDRSYLEDILAMGKELDLHPTIHVNMFEDGIDMVHELDKDDARYFSYLSREDRIKRVENFVEGEMDILSVVYLGDYKKLKALHDQLKFKYKDLYQLYLMNNITIADGLLEIVNGQSNKWTSVLEYSKSIGIKPEEIIALGDDTNDINMIREAGLGIAMGNAIDKVKDVADIILEYDNNNSGVGYALEKLLKL